MNPAIRQRIADIRRGNVPVGYKRTKLGIIPSDWNLRIMGELTSQLTEQNGRSTDFPAYSINNQIGFIPQNLQFEEGSYDYLDKTSYRVVSRGQFAYNPARINVGSIGVLKDREKVIVSSLYICFSVRQEVDSSFLEYWFRTLDFYKEIIRNTEGSVREYLFYENFANIRIALPSLAEQKRIAEILGCCDRVIALKKELIAEKKRQKKALMQKLLNPDSGFRLPGFTGEWKIYELRDLYSFGKSLCASRAQLGVHGIAYLHYGDIHKSTKYYIDVLNEFDNLPKINIAANCSEYMLLDGDVVFVDASEDYDGASKYIVVINPNQKPFLAGLHTIVARPKKQLLSKRFQQFCFQSWGVRHQFFHYTSGMKVFGVSTENLGKIKLSLPSIKEQQDIADILSAADQEIDLLEQELTQQQQKKKSLMQLLLTGIARV